MLCDCAEKHNYSYADNEYNKPKPPATVIIIIGIPRSAM